MQCNEIIISLVHYSLYHSLLVFHFQACSLFSLIIHGPSSSLVYSRHIPNHFPWRLLLLIIINTCSKLKFNFNFQITPFFSENGADYFPTSNIHNLSIIYQKCMKLKVRSLSSNCQQLPLRPCPQNIPLYSCKDGFFTICPDQTNVH